MGNFADDWRKCPLQGNDSEISLQSVPVFREQSPVAAVHRDKSGSNACSTRSSHADNSNVSFDIYLRAPLIRQAFYTL